MHDPEEREDLLRDVAPAASELQECWPGCRCLTARESQVLGRLMQGRTVHDIARAERRLRGDRAHPGEVDPRQARGLLAAGRRRPGAPGRLAPAGPLSAPAAPAAAPAGPAPAGSLARGAQRGWERPRDADSVSARSGEASAGGRPPVEESSTSSKAATAASWVFTSSLRSTDLTWLRTVAGRDLEHLRDAGDRRAGVHQAQHLALARREPGDRRSATSSCRARISRQASSSSIRSSSGVSSSRRTTDSRSSLIGSSRVRAGQHDPDPGGEQAAPGGTARRGGEGHPGHADPLDDERRGPDPRPPVEVAEQQADLRRGRREACGAVPAAGRRPGQRMTSSLVPAAGERGADRVRDQRLV